MNRIAPATRENITSWLVGEGRLLGDGVAIAEGLAERLVASGVPLLRMRIAQRFANPLLAAWGVIWRRDQPKSQDYVMPKMLLETGTWIGSPFQKVSVERASFRRRLIDLHPEKDHTALHEAKEIGGTDFFAMPIEFGDGSVQGMSLTADAEDGFSDADIELFEQLRHPIAAAMEPIAMRRSTVSMLRTYLGKGPSAEIAAGSIRRGALSKMNAVVMFSDLRGFTAKSIAWTDQTLLEALDHYFETVVDAVHGRGGDILKFLGDGILAVFPIEHAADAAARATDALEAAQQARSTLADINRARSAAGEPVIDFGTALHAGEVAYGNIGSLDRLDFTVIGKAVNLASRVEGFCKTLAEPILCTATVRSCLTVPMKSVGAHEIRGMPDPVELFAPTKTGIAS